MEKMDDFIDDIKLAQYQSHMLTREVRALILWYWSELHS